ncbi:hypothetical protein C7H79_03985 [Nitrosomonas supralitoralis]|uniref:Uncharacterized protein n=1 Tax=Nitrosomonas supralitoralis TaxID=2116706 RepID=A0A2P7NXJ4_9PROT|nr:hypothetical protein C7H79_03985 [Nitrosomonas supralitoralis]
MKFIWFFLHIVALSTFVQPTEASKNMTSTEEKGDIINVARVLEIGTLYSKMIAKEAANYSNWRNPHEH